MLNDAAITPVPAGASRPAGAQNAAGAWPVQRKVQAGFTLALVCLAMVGFASFLSVQHLRTNAGWVEHTHQVLTELERLLSLTATAESAQRSYVISGQQDSLSSYETAAAAAGTVERTLARLTADKASQQQRVAHLNDLVAAQLARLRHVNEVRQTFGFSAARQLIQTEEGEHLPNELRRQADRIGQVESALLRERQQRVGRSLAITVAISIGTSLLGLACVAWAAWVSRRDFLERKRIEEEREALQARLAAQLEDMRRLHEFSSRLIVVQDLPKMLEEVLNATLELQHADFGNIQLYDAESATLRIVVQRGFSQAFLDHFRVVDASEPSAGGRVLQSRSRIIVEDVEKDDGYAPHRRAAAEAGYRAVHSTPIIGPDGSVKGVLSAHFREPHRPSDREMQMTDLYMRVAAELIARAQDAETIRSARDEADRASRAKGRFLATASHDLRQPLQALSLLNGTLRRLLTDADAAQTAAQQEQAITVMSGLLNALLDISKLESGAVKPQIGAVDLPDLFEELRVEFADAAARKGLRLEVVPCRHRTVSDRTLLGQILRNLLSNAIRYTRSGCVRLQCDLESRELRLSVVDTGIGISREHLKDIFEEFYQVGVPANTVREGHGLGLSIVKRVAKLLNHDMRVDSEPGKGSQFAVLVPLGDSEGGARTTTLATPASPLPTRKAHVLVVDDDLSVLNATRMLLKVEGYRVSVASSFAVAMDTVRESPDIELLVTDFHLGDGKLGTEVVRRVTEALGRPVKSVLITGDTSSAMRSVADDSHIRLTSKPVNADELLLILKEQAEALQAAPSKASAG